MAMEIDNTYRNYPDSYLNAEDKEKQSVQNYLQKLQKQVPSIKLKIGYGMHLNKREKGNVVVVNPMLLARMQNDPEAEKEYTQYLKSVEQTVKWVESLHRNSKDTTVFRQGYVDENGKYYSCSYVKKEDKLSPKLREERRKNTEKLIEKIREKTAKKRKKMQKELQEALIEKKRKKAKRSCVDIRL